MLFKLVLLSSPFSLSKLDFMQPTSVTFKLNLVDCNIRFVDWKPNSFTTSLEQPHGDSPLRIFTYQTRQAYSYLNQYFTSS
jgi:hypothetical protein